MDFTTNNLINNNGMMSSDEIAILTGKEKGNVVRDIKKIVEQLESFKSERFDYQIVREDFILNNRTCTRYHLNKKACLLLASGYDIILRAKIIDRWEELEKAARSEARNTEYNLPLTYAAALRELVKEVEKNEAMKPDAEFGKFITENGNSVSFGEFGKVLASNGINMGQNKLFDWMRKNGYIFENSTAPKQNYVEQGLFEVAYIKAVKGTVVNLKTMITGKGQRYFVEKIKDSLKENKENNQLTIKF